MDRTDRRILALLQDDADRPVAEIAAAVGLSPTPCWRRIQKLKAAGTIRRTVALVDPQAIGRGLDVFVGVEARDHTPEWLDTFTTTVSGLGEVMEIYRMAGDLDYLLRVSVRDMAQFDDFYRRLIAAVPLKNVTSHFAMERVKHTTAYPVE
jgi:Lrp/AsnC family transcriptional regulator